MRQAELVWLIAHHGPLTVDELKDHAEDQMNTNSVSGTARELWRDGLLAREQLNTLGQPYRYRLADPTPVDDGPAEWPAEAAKSYPFE